jgi:hypothetical protein
VARPFYEHTQAGWPMRVAFLAGALTFFAMSFLQDLRQSGYAQFAMLGGALLMVVVGWLWSSLTVRIVDGTLHLRFGPGFPRKSVSLADIAAVEVTRTTFWEGWGVHLTRRGWLYNVSGFDAVLVRQHDGKSFMVGTDEPRRLKAALERALAGAGTR